jgi:gliding motility-associated-like protein
LFIINVYLSMARILIFFLTLGSTILCDNLYAQYEWRLRECLPGPGRRNIAAFSVGNKGYVVGGFEDGPNIDFAEVWQYDPLTNIWTQKNNFPGGARNGISGFVIHDTAYYGLGFNTPSSTYFTDFYRYDAASDQWIQLADFPGIARYLSMGFSIGDTGYLGCGKGGTQYTDFYKYNPVTNTWAALPNFPGVAREAGIGITVGNSGLVGMGYTAGSCLADMYLYNPASSTWSPISSYNTAGRNGPAFFSFNDTVYAMAGTDGSTNYDDCWRYDVASDRWIQEANFTCLAPGRMAAQGGWFIYGHGYLPLGGVIGGASDFNDLLEYGPHDPAFVSNTGVFGNDTSYCGNFSRVLSTGNACTVWSTGVEASQITVNMGGVYYAYWPGACGMNVDTIAITSGSSSASLGNDTTYCGLFSRVLSTGIAGTTWSTGATGAQITVTSPGTYWATGNNACGTFNDTITINQLTAPQLAFGGDSFLCTGQSFTLNAANPNSTYHWQDNSANSSYQVSGPGIYAVTVTDTSSGCSAKASVNVIYSSQPPQVNLGPDFKVCGNKGAILTVPIANAQYLWNNGSTDSTLLVTASGTYSVTVSNGCSSASSEVNVSVYADACEMYVPTGFSPNGDGVNDFFHAICHCPVSDFSMQVYNRWGEKVYSSTNIQNGWDGTYKNYNAPVAVYVYYIDYMNYCEGKTDQKKGNVTLVR